MKILRNGKVDAIKILTGYGFYVSIFFTVLLCLSSPVYSDGQRNEVYSAASILSQFDEKSMLEHGEMNSFLVSMTGNRGWLSLFIPIIGGFAFVPILCDEYRAGAVRNYIFRSSNFCYHTAKYVMACLSGGLAVMVGYGIYMGIVSMMFPAIGLYQGDLQEVIRQQAMDAYPGISLLGYGGMMALKLVEIFLYGTFSVAWVIFLSSFVRNKYLVLCIPFFLQYAIAQFCTKIRMDAWSGEGFKEKLARLLNIILLDSVADLNQYASDAKYILLFHVIGISLLYAAYMWILGRRTDYGE